MRQEPSRPSGFLVLISGLLHCTHFHSTLLQPGHPIKKVAKKPQQSVSDHFIKDRKKKCNKQSHLRAVDSERQNHPLYK